MQVKSSTSKNTIIHTIMTTKATTDTLQLSFVENPRLTIKVHKVFKNSSRRASERIEKLSAFSVDVHRHPMFAGSVVRVGVADDQSSRILGQSVAAVDAANLSG